MSINAIIAAQNTFSNVFSPRLGKFQISVDAKSKVTIQMQVGFLNWIDIATVHSIDTGTVDNIGGYSAGATVITTSGLTGNWNIDQYFVVVGDTVIHKVTDFTAGTSVTFVPALGDDVIDTAVITRVIPDSGLSLQEQVDAQAIWRVGVVTGDFVMNTNIRLGQS